jgi:hypothetical protein
MTTIMSATNPANKKAILPMAATSKDVRRMLGLSLLGWENTMVVFLIIAGFFALVAGAATWAVVRLQRIEIAESKREFDAYKLTVDGQVADAKKEGIEAGKMAGNALLRAEDLRAANLALESKIAPRRLERAQQQKIADALVKFAGRSVAVTSYTLDADGVILGQQIIEVLQTAGLPPINKLASITPLGNFSLGIHVSGFDDELVSAIRTALSNLGGLTVASKEETQLSAPQAGMTLGDPHVPNAPASVLIGIKPIVR